MKILDRENILDARVVFKQALARPGREMTSSKPQSTDDAGFEHWFCPARFGVVLCAFIIASFPGVILGDQSFVARDFGLFSYPVALYQRACFWRGELPLWDPYHNCGIPFLAQFNTLALYPLSLVYLLLPLAWSLSAFSLVHLFIAGMGMYVLAHEWVSNRFAASVAGLAFAFNGLSLNLLMWPSHIATYAWMPWVVWGVGQGLEHSGRKLLWGVLFGSLQMLAGGPETILLTWVIVGAVALVQCGRRVLPPVHALRRLFMTTVLVAGVCAVQLLPFLNLVAHCQRDASYTSADWATPATGWTNLFVPLFGCFLTRKGIYFQDQQYWTSSYFSGIAVVALALIAIWRVRTARVWLLAAIAVVGLLLASGSHGFLWPALKGIFRFLAVMAHPVKFIYLVVFALPLLGAFGVTALQRSAAGSEGRGNKLLLAVGAVVGLTIFALIVLARFHPQDQEVWTVTMRNGLGRLVILILSIGAFFLLGRMETSTMRVGVGFAILVVVWVDIRTHVPQQNPTGNRTVFEPGMVRLSPQPALGQSRAFVRPEAFKQMLEGTSGNVAKDFLLYRQGLFLDSNLLDGVPTLWGFFSLYTRTDATIQSLLDAPRQVEPTGLLDFVGVSQETDPGDIFKFVPRTTFMPMFTAGQRPVFLDPTNMLPVMAGADFRPREFVFLPPETRPSVTVSTNTDAKIRSTRIFPQRIELDVDAREPSLVVAAQSFDPGWRARIGNTSVRVLQANYGFQAWQVPAGISHVILEYYDPWLGRGVLISAGSFLVCLCLWLARSIAPRSGQGSSMTR